MAPSQHRGHVARSGQFTSSLGPWSYDTENRNHKKIVKAANESIIRSALNDCSFLEESERKQQLQDALATAASCFTDEGNAALTLRKRRLTCASIASATIWAMLNLGTLYKALSPPSGKITAMCKRISRAKVQSGYTLRPSIWLDDSEPEYQKNAVNDLVNESQFPPKFMLGMDEGLGMEFAFEHEVILDVVLDTVVELDWLMHLDDLDNIFCMATVAVYCALMERANGKLIHIEFAVPDFKPMYHKLRDYIRDYIMKDDELRERWLAYKLRCVARLNLICRRRRTQAGTGSS